MYNLLFLANINLAFINFIYSKCDLIKILHILRRYYFKILGQYNEILKTLLNKPII